MTIAPGVRILQNDSGAPERLNLRVYDSQV
jgi:hypothetical protein